jgi:cytochrome c553
MKAFVFSNITCAMIALAGFIWGSNSALALPFNQDMVGGQLITGTVMRPKNVHAVPVGTLERQVPDRQVVAQEWENPFKNSSASAARGERLYAVNCVVCHGVINKGQHTPSDLAAKGIPSLNLLLTQPKYDPAKTDGYIWSYVFRGMDILMPRYGWKLSNNEIWDIVSYVRKLQAESPGL